MRAVRVRLRGQLGNQLFCYFAGAQAALTSGSRLELDCNYFQGKDGTLQLLNLGLPTPFTLTGATPKRTRFLGVSRTQTLFRIAGSLNSFHPSTSLNQRTVTSLSGIHGLVTRRAKRLVLDGYFQTRLCVDAVRRKLGLGQSEILSFKALQPWVVETRRRISEAPGVALHIRLGEYSGSTRQIDYRAYVKQAVEEVGWVGNSERIWLFSDDPDAALKLLGPVSTLEIAVAPMPPQAAATDVLAVLSSMDRFIIANSTFSWWGAYLSGSSRVVAPWPWALPTDEPMLTTREDLFPGGWHAMPPRFVNAN
jgi:hypothetical protein